MIFNDDFNNIVYVLFDLNEDFCQSFLKMKDKIPKKYLKLLGKLSNFSNNEDIYYIYFSHTQPYNCKDAIEFVFGLNGLCYHLMLKNYKKDAHATPNEEFSNKAKSHGCKLEFDRGFYLGEFEICNDINMKKMRYYFQLRQCNDGQYIDILKVISNADDTSVGEVSYNKIYNDDLLLN